MNLHLPPGRQTPSNKPCSNRWTLIEKASIRWRIDYRLSSQGLTGRALWAVAERAASHGERWSDHAPVTVAYDHEA